MRKLEQTVDLEDFRTAPPGERWWLLGVPVDFTPAPAARVRPTRRFEHLEDLVPRYSGPVVGARRH